MLLLKLVAFLPVLSLVFLAIAISTGVNKSVIDEETLSTKAIVVGYDRSQHSGWYSLKVKIPILGNESKVYLCRSRRIAFKDYPIGSEVEVYYVPKKHFGMSWTQAYLKGQLPGPNKSLSLAFYSLALVTALSGIVLWGIAVIALWYK